LFVIELPPALDAQFLSSLDDCLIFGDGGKTPTKQTMSIDDWVTNGVAAR